MSSYSSVRIKEELASQTLLTSPRFSPPDFHHMFQNYPPTFRRRAEFKDQTDLTLG